MKSFWKRERTESSTVRVDAHLLEETAARWIKQPKLGRKSAGCTFASRQPHDRAGTCGDIAEAARPARRFVNVVGVLPAARRWVTLQQGAEVTSPLSQRTSRAPRVWLTSFALWLVMLDFAGAQSSITTLRKRLTATNANVATTSLTSYLARVKADNQSIQPTAGAIWTDAGRLTQLSSDVRAMRPHDLIAVVVQESLAASTDGTVKNQRASTANSAITGLIGPVKANSALQNLFNQSSGNTLNAAGASATNSSLTTTFGGQVIDVLPNGMLVIEAARQVEFSQQTQTILLRGLVRPEDISQQNEVKSTAISSLELEVKGKGIVNDYTRRQNPIVRLLQQILIF